MSSNLPFRHGIPITAAEVQEHLNDYIWLDEHLDSVFRQAQEGVQYAYSAVDAIELLNQVVPYALTRLDYRRWEPVLFDALQHAMELRDDEFQIQIWAHLGICFLQSGRNKTASEAFHNALAHVERDVTAESGLLARIGMLRTKMFYETSDIADFIAESLTAAREVDQFRLLGTLHHTLAGIYTRRAETRTALGHSQVALACWYKLRNEKEKIRTFLEMSEICRIAKRYEQAARYLDMIHGEAKDVYSTAIYHYNQGSIAFERDDLEEASRCYDIALEQFRILDFPQLTGAAHHALALVQTKHGRYDPARDNLRRALIIWQQLDIPYEQVSGVYALGFLEEKAGNPQAARHLYGEGLKLIEGLPMSPMVEELFAEITQHLEALPS